MSATNFFRYVIVYPIQVIWIIVKRAIISLAEVITAGVVLLSAHYIWFAILGLVVFFSIYLRSLWVLILLEGWKIMPFLSKNFIMFRDTFQDLLIFLPRFLNYGVEAVYLFLDEFFNRYNFLEIGFQALKQVFLFQLEYLQLVIDLITAYWVAIFNGFLEWLCSATQIITNTSNFCFVSFNTFLFERKFFYIINGGFYEFLRGVFGFVWQAIELFRAVIVPYAWLFFKAAICFLLLTLQTFYAITYFILTIIGNVILYVLYLIFKNDDFQGQIPTNVTDINVQNYITEKIGDLNPSQILAVDPISLLRKNESDYVPGLMEVRLWFINLLETYRFALNWAFDNLLLLFTFADTKWCCFLHLGTCATELGLCDLLFGDNSIFGGLLDTISPELGATLVGIMNFLIGPTFFIINTTIAFINSIMGIINIFADPDLPLRPFLPIPSIPAYNGIFSDRINDMCVTFTTLFEATDPCICTMVYKPSETNPADETLYNFGGGTLKTGVVCWLPAGVCLSADGNTEVYDYRCELITQSDYTSIQYFLIGVATNITGVVIQEKPTKCYKWGAILNTLNSYDQLKLDINWQYSRQIFVSPTWDSTNYLYATDSVNNTFPYYTWSWDSLAPPYDEFIELITSTFPSSEISLNKPISNTFGHEVKYYRHPFCESVYLGTTSEYKDNPVYYDPAETPTQYSYIFAFDACNEFVLLNSICYKQRELGYHTSVYSGFAYDIICPDGAKFSSSYVNNKDKMMYGLAQSWINEVRNQVYRKFILSALIAKGGVDSSWIDDGIDGVLGLPSAYHSWARMDPVMILDCIAMNNATKLCNDLGLTGVNCISTWSNLAVSYSPFGILANNILYWIFPDSALHINLGYTTHGNDYRWLFNKAIIQVSRSINYNFDSMIKSFYNSFSIWMEFSGLSTPADYGIADLTNVTTYLQMLQLAPWNMTIDTLVTFYLNHIHESKYPYARAWPVMPFNYDHLLTAHYLVVQFLMYNDKIQGEITNMIMIEKFGNGTYYGPNCSFVGVDVGLEIYFDCANTSSYRTPNLVALELNAHSTRVEKFWRFFYRNLKSENFDNIGGVTRLMQRMTESSGEFANEAARISTTSILKKFKSIINGKNLLAYWNSIVASNPGIISEITQDCINVRLNPHMCRVYTKPEMFQYYLNPYSLDPRDVIKKYYEMYHNFGEGVKILPRISTFVMNY